ncbi:hypothetical protein NE237_022997 [Protea cynaroides]|uniref:Uncharacterized protein n=1 Tax=Protea cynaroides TaxID=273540 RepID=A0A9Q0HBE7_9MAGN|nr:hypothetical protein NE237_022997 [Protea cynaroides]
MSATYESGDQFMEQQWEIGIRQSMTTACNTWDAQVFPRGLSDLFLSVSRIGATIGGDVVHKSGSISASASAMVGCKQVMTKAMEQGNPAVRSHPAKTMPSIEGVGGHDEAVSTPVLPLYVSDGKQVVELICLNQALPAVNLMVFAVVMYAMFLHVTGEKEGASDPIIGVGGRWGYENAFVPVLTVYMFDEGSRALALVEDLRLD